MNTSKVPSYLPNLDSAFKLKYSSFEKEKISLQHAQQDPYVFEQNPEKYRNGASSSRRLEEDFHSNTTGTCYSSNHADLEAYIKIVSSGRIDAHIRFFTFFPLESFLPGKNGKNHSFHFQPPCVEGSSRLEAFFCNASLAPDNTIVAEGWSTHTLPYIYAPWTLHHPDEDGSTVILSLGSEKEYILTKGGTCSVALICYSR